MSASHKPEGYPTVSPYLIVDGAEGTIRFLTEALGAVELRRFPGENGAIAHAEVRLGDSVLMLGDRPEGMDPVPAHVHIYVADVDAAHARAVEQGGKNVQDPVKREDADKRGGVRDAGGTTWWLATKVE